MTVQLRALAAVTSLVLLLSTGSSAGAQNRAVQAGDRVRVWPTGVDRRIEGPVARVTADSLVLLSARGPVAHAFADMERVEVRVQSSRPARDVAVGAILGAAALSISGGLLAHACCDESSDSYFPPSAMAATLLIVPGAILGGRMMWKATRWEEVSTRTSVGMGAGRNGVNLALRLSF